VSRERRLGRGLEALLGRAGIDPAAPAPRTDGSAAVAGQPTPKSAGGLGSGAARLILHAAEEVEEVAASLPTNDLAIALIDPNPWQPRTQLGGQRRLAAAGKLGWTSVPARVLEVEDRQMAEIAIVENLQRRDLDALEKAASFKQYLATWGCTQDELAKRLSIDRSHVANLIRLLELPAAVQDRLRAGKLSMGHARALLPLGEEAEQVRLADRVAAEGLSVRAVETEVQEILRRDEEEPEQAVPGGSAADDAGPAAPPPKRKPGRPATRRSSQVAAVETQLRRALGVKVVVHANSKGAGRIVIPFASLDEFQRLLEHVCE
jgi:ParB family chromosome partitioning protein